MTIKFSTENVVSVNKKRIDHLKTIALNSTLKRSRVLLHQSKDDAVHQMINIFCSGTYVRPHKHPERKSESYHIIDGELHVFIFDDVGRVIDRHHLLQNGHGSIVLRMMNVWHMPLPVTDFVVFHEIYTGPFIKDHDVVYADWSPEELSDISIIDAFLKKCKE